MRSIGMVKFKILWHQCHFWSHKKFKKNVCSLQATFSCHSTTASSFATRVKDVNTGFFRPLDWLIYEVLSGQVYLIILLIPKERKNGFIPFLRHSETPSISSRIWILLAEAIFNDDNRYNMSASIISTLQQLKGYCSNTLGNAKNVVTRATLS